MLIMVKKNLEYCNNLNVIEINHNLKKNNKKLNNSFPLHAYQSYKNEAHYLACYK